MCTYIEPVDGTKHWWQEDSKCKDDCTSIGEWTVTIITLTTKIPLQQETQLKVVTVDQESTIKEKGSLKNQVKAVDRFWVFEEVRV